MVGEHTRSLEVIIAVSIEIMGVIYLVKKHLTFLHFLCDGCKMVFEHGCNFEQLARARIFMHLLTTAARQKIQIRPLVGVSFYQPSWWFAR